MSKEEFLHLCDGLPTNPDPEIGKVLVTGATGYIGGRLVPELIHRGYKVRIMVRSDSPHIRERWPQAEIVVADARNLENLLEALEGIDTAYYLIHSLGLGEKKFEAVDLEVAINFRTAAENKGLKRIIFLSGLGDSNTNLSSHLESRTKVAEKLKQGKIPVTILRSGMIIGSGSASYEILKNLVKNSFVFVIPYWAKTKSQPIAIRDVIKYLVGVLEIKETQGKTFDIGGSTIITYDQKLKLLAELQNKKRIYLPGLITYTPLYGYIISLLTPVPGPITKGLVAGCKNEVICRNNDIENYINFKPLGFREALIRAMSIEELDNINTRWSDSYPPEHELSVLLHQLDNPPHYTSSYCLLTRKSEKSLFESFCYIGGKTGWFNTNWLWRMRGAIDRLFLGVGSSRGRRSYKNLRIGDAIDFWRVENIVVDKLLLLRAEMKLPGKAWLEFYINSYENLNKLTVNAYFQPKGFWGKPYWYFFLPFHVFIFRDLIVQIEKRS